MVAPPASADSGSEVLAIVPAARPVKRAGALTGPSRQPRWTWLELAHAAQREGYRLVLNPDLPDRAGTRDAGAAGFLGAGPGRGWLARTQPIGTDTASPAGAGRITLRPTQPGRDLDTVLLLQMVRHGGAGGLDLLPSGPAIQGPSPADRLDVVIRLRVQDGGAAADLATIQQRVSALFADLLGRLRQAGYGPLGDPDRREHLALSLAQDPAPVLFLDALVPSRPAPHRAGNQVPALATDAQPAPWLQVVVRPWLLDRDADGRLASWQPGTGSAPLHPSRLLGWPVAAEPAAAADPLAPPTALIVACPPALSDPLPDGPDRPAAVPVEPKRSSRIAPGDDKATPHPKALAWPAGPAHRETGGLGLEAVPQGLAGWFTRLLLSLDQLPPLELDSDYPQIGPDPWGSLEDGDAGAGSRFQAGRHRPLPPVGPAAPGPSVPQAPGLMPEPADQAPSPALAAERSPSPAAAEPGPEVMAMVPAARPTERKRALAATPGQHRGSWLELAWAAHREGCRLVLNPDLPSHAGSRNASTDGFPGPGRGWLARTRPAGTDLADPSGAGGIALRPAQPAQDLETVLLLQMAQRGGAGGLDLLPSGSAIQGPSPADRLDVVIRLRIQDGGAAADLTPSLATIQRTVSTLLSNLLTRLRAAGYGPLGDPHRREPLAFTLAQDPAPALFLDVRIQFQPETPGLAPDADPARRLQVLVRPRLLGRDGEGRLASGQAGAGLAHLQVNRLLDWPMAEDALPATASLAPVAGPVLSGPPVPAPDEPAPVPVESKRSGWTAPGDDRATARPLALAWPAGTGPREAGGLGLEAVPQGLAGWFKCLLLSMDEVEPLEMDGDYPRIGLDLWGSMGDGDSSGGSLFQVGRQRPPATRQHPDGQRASVPALGAAADRTGVPALESPLPAAPAAVAASQAVQLAERKRPGRLATVEEKDRPLLQPAGSAARRTGSDDPGASGLGLEPAGGRGAQAATSPAGSGSLEGLRLMARTTLVEFNGTADLTWNRPPGDRDSLWLSNDRDPGFRERVGNRDGQLGVKVPVRHRHTYALHEHRTGAAGIHLDAKARAGIEARPAPTVIVAARGVDHLAGDFGGPGQADGRIQPGPDELPDSHTARFLLPKGMARDGHGRIYVCDALGNTIRKIDGTRVSTLAGDPDQPAGLEDGRYDQARFHEPQGLAVQPDGGAVYVADTRNHAVRRVWADGSTETLAGGSGAGRNDGPGRKARFNQPTAVALNPDGTALYVADSGNGRVRRIALAGGRNVTTLPVAGLKLPAGLAVRADAKGAEHLYVADKGRHVILDIRTAAPVTCSVLAGMPDRDGFEPGKGAAAAFRGPQALALTSGGDLLVADTGNVAIRQVALQGDEAGTVTDLPAFESKTGEGRPRTLGGILDYGGGRLLVADPGQSLIWCAGAGDLRPFAGSLAAPAGLVDGVGGKARFAGPSDILVTRGGRVLVADRGNGRIREVGPDGQVVTLPIQEPDVPIEPHFLAEDGAEGVYFTSVREATVEHLHRDGRLRRVARLPRRPEPAGEPAKEDKAAPGLRAARGIARDRRGTLYVAYGHGILRINKSGMSRLAGHLDQPGMEDGDATQARFNTPVGLAWRDGHLYVADADNHAIRRVSPEGRVETVFGQLGQARPDEREDEAGHLLSEPCSLAFSPDGAFLYVVEGDRAGIRRITVADGSARPLMASTHLPTAAGRLPGSGWEPRELMGRLGPCAGLACNEWGDILALSRPSGKAGGGVLQITAPERRP